ncbi:MAG: hypothetical protein H0V87_02260 [Chloroflexi bacterium]|nr:hypothetical protein [Chloroflexota bacterium]
MTDPRAAHADHDLLLVAAHAAGDLDGDDGRLASGLIAECRECSDLHADLQSLSTAVRNLPAPVRTREFLVSPGDAARLRRAGWRRLLQVFAGSRLGLARPVGAAFASLGLAGLLLTALPSIPLGGSVAAPSRFGAPAIESQAGEDSGSSGAGAGESGARTNLGSDTGVGSGGPAASSVPLKGAPAEVAGDGPARQEQDAPATEDDERALTERATDAILTVLSGTFLVVGLGLFGLGWARRRTRDG